MNRPKIHASCTNELWESPAAQLLPCFLCAQATDERLRECSRLEICIKEGVCRSENGNPNLERPPSYSVTETTSSSQLEENSGFDELAKAEMRDRSQHLKAHHMELGSAYDEEIEMRKASRLAAKRRRVLDEARALGEALRAVGF